MTVTETGDRCRYYVSSEAHPRNQYLVDLLDHEGVGCCSCRDWICRCWPIIKKGQRAMCKHVKAARAHFLDHLLQTMAKAETQ